MSRNKLRKFAEFRTMHNCISYDDQNAVQQIQQFVDSKPLVLEIAAGRGEYAVALASEHTDRKYIAVDIQGERLWYGAVSASQKRLENIKFLRSRVEFLPELLELNSVSEIWITFPDPFPRDRQAKHRLTADRFLEIYKQILMPGGMINLKTDSQLLIEFTLEQLKRHSLNPIQYLQDVYKSDHNPELDIKTKFEGKHLKSGKTISYLSFNLTK